MIFFIFIDNNSFIELRGKYNRIYEDRQLEIDIENKSNKGRFVSEDKKLYQKELTRSLCSLKEKILELRGIINNGFSYLNN